MDRRAFLGGSGAGLAALAALGVDGTALAEVLSDPRIAASLESHSAPSFSIDPNTTVISAIKDGREGLWPVSVSDAGSTQQIRHKVPLGLYATGSGQSQGRDSDTNNPPPGKTCCIYQLEDPATSGEQGTGASPSPGTSQGISLAGSDKTLKVTHPLAVSPIETPEDKPHMSLALKLISLHVDPQLVRHKDVKAMLRFVVSKSDRNANTDLKQNMIYSMLASGLNLYNEMKGKEAKPIELEADYTNALDGKRIFVRDGIATIWLDVRPRREKTSLEKILDFFINPAGQQLATAFGFPQLTLQAMQFLAGVMDNLWNTDQAPLISTLHGYTVALHTEAVKRMTNQTGAVRIGALRDGYWLISSAADKNEIEKSKPFLDLSTGRLVRTVQPLDTDEDSYPQLTYAVVQAKCQSESESSDPSGYV